MTDAPVLERTQIDLLDAIWGDLSATGLSGRFMNNIVVEMSRLQSTGVPMLQVSPYDMPGPEAGTDEIRETLERHIDFDEIPDLCVRDTPELLVGTVNINAGIFETFTNEKVTPKAILASAAVPAMFEAVEIDGHYHWDGLFSQTPPIDDLMTVDVDRKPRGCGSFRSIRRKVRASRHRWRRLLTAATSCRGTSR